MSLRPVPTRVYDNKGNRKLIARLASDEPEFKAAAEKVKLQILLQMSKHVETGRLMGALSMEKGKVDYFITADPVVYDWHAEFGHWTVPGKKLDEKGKKKEPVWVQGIGVFRRVVELYGGF